MTQLRFELRSRKKTHLVALGQMLIVTLLWSSSFPIHKALMNAGMPALSLAAYRYFSAALILVGALAVRRRHNALNHVEIQVGAEGPRAGLGALVLIGLCMYGAQGIHMAALSLLSAADSGLISMTWMPIGVILLALVLEGKLPQRAQFVGLLIILAGLYAYFPLSLRGARLLGICLNLISSSMWAVAVVTSHRTVNQTRISSLKLTAVTMLSGSSILLIAALAHDRAYMPDLREAAWLGYLALVNTAFGFALYNHTMKALGAFEIAVFQDSMIVQIGILSAIFLHEAISARMALGMVMVSIGVAAVQIFAPHRAPKAPAPVKQSPVPLQTH